VSSDKLDYNFTSSRDYADDRADYQSQATKGERERGGGGGGRALRANENAYIRPLAASRLPIDQRSEELWHTSMSTFDFQPEKIALPPPRSLFVALTSKRRGRAGRRRDAPARRNGVTDSGGGLERRLFLLLFARSCRFPSTNFRFPRTIVADRGDGLPEAVRFASCLSSFEEKIAPDRGWDSLW
jgi:hypothetical protein